MPMRPLSLDTVFHPSDFSTGDEGAFAHALKIALAKNGKLRLLHVDSGTDSVHWSDFPRIRPMLERWGLIAVGSGKQAVKDSGLQVEKVKRSGDDPVRTILDYLEDHQPGLVVLATHQRKGLSRWLHATVAEPIARQAQVMTLFVPRRVTGFVSIDSGRARLRNILIPIDRRPAPQRAVDAAVGMARCLDAREVCFHLLHVGLEEDMPRVEVPLEAGWRVERSAWNGPVVDHILEVAEDRDADMIAMATEGHKGFLDALRGSTTELVLRGANCPVLAIPG